MLRPGGRRRANAGDTSRPPPGQQAAASSSLRHIRRRSTSIRHDDDTSPAASPHFHNYNSMVLCYCRQAFFASPAEGAKQQERKPLPPPAPAPPPAAEGCGAAAVAVEAEAGAEGCDFVIAAPPLTPYLTVAKYSCSTEWRLAVSFFLCTGGQEQREEAGSGRCDAPGSPSGPPSWSCCPASSQRGTPRRGCRRTARGGVEQRRALSNSGLEGGRGEQQRAREAERQRDLRAP